MGSSLLFHPSIPKKNHISWLKKLHRSLQQQGWSSSFLHFFCTFAVLRHQKNHFGQTFCHKSIYVIAKASILGIFGFTICIFK